MLAVCSARTCWCQVNSSVSCLVTVQRWEKQSQKLSLMKRTAAGMAVGTKKHVSAGSGAACVLLEQVQAFLRLSTPLCVSPHLAVLLAVCSVAAFAAEYRKAHGGHRSAVGQQPSQQHSSTAVCEELRGNKENPSSKHNRTGKPEVGKHLGIWVAGREKHPQWCCRLFSTWDLSRPAAAGLRILLGVALGPRAPRFQKGGGGKGGGGRWVTTEEGLHWWAGAVQWAEQNGVLSLQCAALL